MKTIKPAPLSKNENYIHSQTTPKNPKRASKNTRRRRRAS